MTDEDKTKEQLIAELRALRQKVADSETPEAEGTQLEKEPMRQARLGALREMSAGISHNMNNILASLLASARVVREDMDDPDTSDPETSLDVDQVIQDGERAMELVQRLQRAMDGEERDALYPAYLNAAVRHAIGAAQPRWKEQLAASGVEVELITELEQVPRIWAMESGLNEILLNLFENSVDAMPRGGTITVRTRAEGNTVVLDVSDTGIGMEEETLQRAFEPFFTTKKTVGQGLGLSEVYGMVDRWGGTVEAISTPGEGATFTLRFRECDS